MVKKAVNRLWVTALLFLLPLLYFLPGRVILSPGDGWTQNLGVRYLIGESIKHGIIPLWNPYIFAGMPLLATVYPGALYPPNWLFAVLSPVWAMNIVVISTFQLALIGTYLFARSLNLTRIGAIVAGITFTFGGFMIAHIGHTSRIAAAAWLPWVLLALEKIYQENQWRWVSLGALFIFLQFVAGEPQMLFYTALTSAAYVLFSLLFREQNFARWKFILSGSMMALCGVLFSLPLLLPARELQAQGARANMAYEHFSAFSLPPKQVLAFIFPYFFGGAAQPPYLQAPWGTSFWGDSTVNASAGYVGLIGLMLIVVAIVSAQKRSLVWLWLFVAVASLFLAFGGYLPLHINEFLHKVPGYNVFRGSYRHQLEFTFALAMLAGTGLSRLTELEEKNKWRAVLIGIGTVGLLVLGTAIIYFQFAEKLVTTAIRLKEFGQFSNAEAYIPLSVFCLGTIALLVYAKWKNTTTAILIVIIALIDVASFGWFYEWRNPEIKEMSRRLPDAPTVQFIKSKEADLNAFRIVSYGATPFKENYEFLDYPNNSIMRGLQSVNGYDVLRLSRVATLAGDLDEEGKIIDTNAFAAEHQGYNILNVKYLLRERPHQTDLAATIDRQGIKFNPIPLTLKNSPGSHFEMSFARSPATEIAIISSLANSIHLKDGTPILKIKLHDKSGKIIERELLAGKDSSEWAYDRSDVKANTQHSRAPVIESWDVDGYQGHRYLARLNFERADIERVEIDYAASTAECFIMHASLFDATTQKSSPIYGVELPQQRWQKVFDGPVEIYQNQAALPRAWFVNNLLVQPEAETLKILKEGKLQDGAPFEPAKTALLELEDFGGQNFDLPTIGDLTNPEIKTLKYAPNRIVLETNNDAPSFLVLSEIYYRGWEARIDGLKVPTYRVNHTLRGVAINAGPHQIEFKYRPSSFRAGLLWGSFGLLLLAIGGGVRGKYRTAEISALTRINQFAERGAKLLFSFATTRGTPVIFLLGLLIYGGVLLSRTSFSVGGSDTSGYANLAYSLVHGPIAQPITELKNFSLPNIYSPAFTPLAYFSSLESDKMIPFYPVGLPIHIALFSLVTGWMTGPYILSPILALLSLWILYLVGIELGLSRSYAAAASALLACNPTFVSLSLQPMSDVAATFWALVIILATLRSNRNERWSLLAGFAFGVAFLVRPTNILLLLPLLLSVRISWRSLLFVGLGGLPLAIIFFAFNTAAFGHPLNTGYGSINLQQQLILDGFGKRFLHYTYWLAMTMSPIALLSWVLVPLQSRLSWRIRFTLLTWFGTYLIFYSFYAYYDTWWYTRFLLPGMPALLLAVALVTQNTVAAFLEKFQPRVLTLNASGWMLGVVLFIIAGFELWHVREFNLLNTGAVQQAHRTAAGEANRIAPPNAMIISMEMSGTLKYYADRTCLRWDLTPADKMKEIAHLAKQQRRPIYALLMTHEIEPAQQKLNGDWIKISEFGEQRAISLWRVTGEW